MPVRDPGFCKAEDLDTWEAARKAGAIPLTQESDFEDRVTRRGPPPHVLWLTCGNTSEARLQAMLEASLPAALKLIRQGEPAAVRLGNLASNPRDALTDDH